MKILSLGWGVQSWTLAAMVALGDLEPIDSAIHADTTWEMSRTYKFAEEWTPWLEERGVKVLTVSDRECAKKVVDKWEGVFIPAFTISEHGKKGQLRRQCTGRWKIQPVHRMISQLLKKRGLKKDPGVVDLWLGITTDEWFRAKKNTKPKYIEHVHPLLDMDYKRSDCIQWLRDHNLPNPGKSSCTYCPFHSKLFWQKMKREGGEDWKEAVMVDEIIRDKRPPQPLFVHDARVPLPEAVKIPEDYGAKQPEMFDVEDMECGSGYCFL